MFSEQKIADHKMATHSSKSAFITKKKKKANDDRTDETIGM